MSAIVYQPIQTLEKCCRFLRNTDRLLPLAITAVSVASVAALALGALPAKAALLAGLGTLCYFASSSILRAVFNTRAKALENIVGPTAYSIFTVANFCAIRGIALSGLDVVALACAVPAVIYNDCQKDNTGNQRR